MDIQEAIDLISEDIADAILNDKGHDAYVLAVKALQEQAEREKGCSLCHGERLKNVAIVNHWGEDQIALVSGHVDENEQVAFCPKCGRRRK